MLLGNKDIKVSMCAEVLKYATEEKRSIHCQLCISFDLYFNNSHGSSVFMAFYCTEIPLKFSCLE